MQVRGVVVLDARPASAFAAGHLPGAVHLDVFGALARDDVAIVDTRSRAEYTGELVRAARGGSIPGAVHLEWTRNLAPDGRYRPAGELRAMYAQTGITPEREIITYCQGGYR